MSSQTFTKGALTGGTSGCLDAIDGDDIAVGDRAMVITTTQSYFYRVISSSASESSPDIITPDANDNSLRWSLIGTCASSLYPTITTGTFDLVEDTTSPQYITVTDLAENVANQVELHITAHTSADGAYPTTIFANFGSTTMYYTSKTIGGVAVGSGTSFTWYVNSNTYSFVITWVPSDNRFVLTISGTADAGDAGAIWKCTEYV